MAVTPGPAAPRGAAGRDRGTGALVALAVFSTAFNDLWPLLPAGELSSDAFIYVFPILLLYLLRRPGEVAAPTSLTLLALALAIALIAGVALNHGEISAAWFKGRSGFSRVVTQGMAAGFGVAVALAFFNVTIRGALPAVARGARLAVLVMGAVGVLEFASWASIPLLTQAHEALALVVHAGSGLDYPERLRATAFEVSWAAVMLTFLFPFAIADLSPRDWRFGAVVALVLFLVVLAQSRTALLVIGGQGLLLGGLFLRRRIDLAVHGAALGCFLGLALLLAPGIGDRIGETLVNVVRHGSLDGPEQPWSDENVSNVTRLAAIRSGVSMFRDQPLFGVGLGQYGFNYPAHLDAEDFRSWEVRLYVADAEDLWPPAYSIHVRLLAETGVVGYAIWLALILPLLARSLMRADVDAPGGRVHVAVAMTLSGWLLLGASIDSFRFFGGWIAVGVALGLAGRGAPRGMHAPPGA